MVNTSAVYKDTPDYCHYYFDLIESENLLEELVKSQQITLELFQLITPENENFAYQPEKWTIKEVLRHIVECERVYTYRAFRFSRFDETHLSGFDENIYIENGKMMNQSLSDLKDEYQQVRKASVSLFKNMTNEMLDFKGTANNSSFTARALGFLTVGHNLHHCNFINTKYLNR